MSDKFIRKNVVFNKKSRWHMKILERIEKESDNFSGYVMSILKAHFDVKPEIKELDKENEQPTKATRIINNSSANLKLKD